MSRIVRKKYEKLIELLDKAIPQVSRLLEEGHIQESLLLLENCQETAITLGSHIEKMQGVGTRIVQFLEEYCEKLYEISIALTNDSADKKEISSLCVEWEAIMQEIKGAFEEELPDRLEVVFLPYKVSMWDSMESIWLAADADEDCDAYIVPIPYYDKDKSGNYSAHYWEGEKFPENEAITHYKDYDIAFRQPDVIFIHNPYDKNNTITSIEPGYYSGELKKHTDKLIYVPYFMVPGEPSMRTEHFVITKGVINSDYVFVQNERMKDFYVETLSAKFADMDQAFLEKKIVAMGSPKTDKIINTKREDLKIPENWKKYLEGKKVVFFNTNVSMLLENPNHIIENLRRIMDIFRSHTEFTVIWREHPLTMVTLAYISEELREAYLKLRDEYVEQGYGIIDETADPYMAMTLSDCYFGAGGSLSGIYPISGKPVLIMDHLYPERVAPEDISLEDFKKTTGLQMLYQERNQNTLDLFLSNIEVFQELKDEIIEKQSVRSDNLDGTVGEKIYSFVKKVMEGD